MSFVVLNKYNKNNERAFLRCSSRTMYTVQMIFDLYDRDTAVREPKPLQLKKRLKKRGRERAPEVAHYVHI